MAFFVALFVLLGYALFEIWEEKKTTMKKEAG